MDFVRLRELNAVAVRYSVELVAGADGPDWSQPSVCTNWTLGDLLGHMTVQHRGFAAAARGVRTELADWAVPALGPDPVADYRAAAAEVLAAFAGVVDGDQGFVLPEISTVRAIPAGTAVGFHLIDYLVHGWDVAATLGLPFDPDPDVVAAGVPIALAVPDGPGRLAAGSSFAPGLAVPDDTDPMDRILRVLGRDPHTAGR